MTIATGIDLGQQSAKGLEAKGVSPELICRFKPYLGLKTRAAVTAAGLTASNLRLTLAEALALDTIFEVN